MGGTIYTLYLKKITKLFIFGKILYMVKAAINNEPVYTTRFF